MRAGKVQAYFAYPTDPATAPVRVYGQDEGIFKNGQYQAVAERLLTAAVTDQDRLPPAGRSRRRRRFFRSPRPTATGSRAGG